MTLITQMDCCTILGVDPKTLRHWCSSAHMEFVPHPTDARLKCLTPEQVQQLATLHSRPRPLPALAPTVANTGASLLQDQYASEASGNEISFAAATSSLDDQAELRTVVSRLQDKVMTEHSQLTQVTLELLRERSERYEHRLSTLEALLPQSRSPLACKPELAVPIDDHEPNDASVQRRQPLPAEQRARSKAIARIEYSPGGSYVLISPQEGELFFAPDSPEWFEWLASLPSFRFVGQSGHFTAYRVTRRGEPTRRWSAKRGIHYRNYGCYLGATDRLTIACLEQAAASLQAHKA